MQNNVADRTAASQRVTLVSIAVNLFIAIAQIVVGIIGHSQALVADGVHTLSDLSSDTLVLVAVKHGAKEADEDHPYGHARYETAATLALAIMLGIVAIGIGYSAAGRLFDPSKQHAVSVFSVWAAAGTIIAKEGLYRYTAHIGRKYQSSLLLANAWHHRSDAISSVIVLIGILGNLAGYLWLDAAAAIGVALMILWMAFSLGKDALDELVDAGLEPEKLEEMERIIRSVDGVENMHMLRSRKAADQVLADVHIQVGSTASVSEGHMIGDTVRCLLREKFPELTDITVHIDPENDETVCIVRPLPLRSEIEARLKDHFTGIPEADAIRQINLHYLSGKIDVELIMPLAALDNMEAKQSLTQKFRDRVKDDEEIGDLQLLLV